MEMEKQVIHFFWFNYFIMDYTIFYKRSFDNGNVDCGEGYDFFFLHTMLAKGLLLFLIK